MTISENKKRYARKIIDTLPPRNVKAALKLSFLKTLGNFFTFDSILLRKVRSAIQELTG